MASGPILSKFFIPGNVPSSKNLIRTAANKRTGKPYTYKDKRVVDYEKRTDLCWINGKDLFLKAIKGKPKPIKVRFTFIRDSKRKFDENNASQLPQDLMVKYGWLQDDNSSELTICFGEHSVNKDRAGVIVEVI